MTVPELRPAQPEDRPAVLRVLSDAFQDPGVGRFDLPAPERMVLAVTGPTIIGVFASASRDLTLPGAVVPTAHIAGVGVDPSWRNRGVLTSLMTEGLRQLPVTSGEAIAVLWASEARIFQRFGFGLAVQALQLTIESREVRVLGKGGAGRLRTVVPSEAMADLVAVYDAVRPFRPGWSARDDARWHHLLSAADEPIRGVVHEGQHGANGYALWYTEPHWTSTGPDARVRVVEVVTDDADVYTSLWHFLLTLSLVRSVSFDHAAVDEPLLHLVDEPRRLGARLVDALWMRILDVSRALRARRYAAPVDLTLEISDDLLAGNRGQWRLRAYGPVVECERASNRPDLYCDIRDLGAALLGGTSIATLAAAGRVSARDPGAVHALTAAMEWPSLPSAPELF